MRIDATAALDHPTVHYSFTLQESPAAWEHAEQFCFADDVCVQGEYWSTDGSVHIQGKIAARLDVRCSRCLKPMQYQFDEPFEGVFAREEDIEEGVYGLESKVMVLDKLILDEVSLALPPQYLCKPDCKGLCPKCGIDRNVETCDCDTTSNGLNPFEKLKDLF